LLDDIDTRQLEGRWPIYKGKKARQQNAACKRLFASLAASSEPEKLSLICDPLAASSMDQPEEHIGRTMSPVVRGRNTFFCYWSSRGSEDENTDEFLAYRLCHPLCVVDSIQVRPFQAWFQGGNPIYAPKRVSAGLGGIHLPNITSPAAQPYGMGKDPAGAIHANLKRFEEMGKERCDGGDGGGDSEDGSSSNETIKKSTLDWMTLTKEYPIEQEDRLQTIHLPPRTVAVGGYLQINFHGRTQRQEADDQYYSK
jgi:hypothetical protein